MEPDDLGLGYLARLQEDEAGAAMHWLQAQAGAAMAAQGSPAGETAQAIPAQDTQQPQQAAPGASQGQAPSQGGWMDLLNQGLRALGQAPATSGITDAAKQVPGAAGRAFVESPRAIYRGVVGPFDELGKWLAESLPIPKTGNETADAILQWQPGQHLPNLMPDKPASGGGQVVEGITRFLVGFIPALRATRALGAGKVGGSIAAGGISDFLTRAPNENNLSSLIQSFPQLQNPVTEFLANDPNDPEVINRLRNSVEGLGLGVATEGVVLGIRAIAAASRARQAGPDVLAQGQQIERQVQATEKAATMVAPQDAELVSKLTKVQQAADLGGVPPDVAAKGVAGAADEAAARSGQAGHFIPARPGAEEGVFVNWGRISSPDDVKAVIDETAKAFRPQIVEAQRGVQSNTQTKALAEQMGLSVEQILSRPAGATMNAETAYAARQVLNSSAQNLLALARRAADPASATPVDLYNFRRALSVHQAIQAEVIGARTETARALQAWAIPAGSEQGEMLGRAIMDSMQRMGGAESTHTLAAGIASLGDAAPGAIATLARRGWAATTMDMARESVVLGHLWRPSTHIVNNVSNMAVAFQQLYERGAAANIGKLLGSSVDERVVDGEALAMTAGMLASLKDAFRLAGRSLATGESSALGKLELPFQQAITSGTISREMGHSVLQAEEFRKSTMGRAIDFIGGLIRAPGRALGASDEFFKTIGYSAEVNAQALRQATREGLDGEAFTKRVADLVANPPDHIKLAATDAALYNTFTNKPGEWAQKVMQLRDSGSLNPTFVVLPYIRTPANILRYTFERSPLAPLVKQWRDDIAAGGARRDLALARMATGSAILAVAMDYASSGVVTGGGPKEPARRQALLNTGWQPYSIKVGDKYVSYNRADPFAMPIAVAAGLAEKMKDGDLSDDDLQQADEAVAGVIGTLAAAVTDKTFFTGVTTVFNAIEAAGRGQEGQVLKMLQKTAAGMVPMESLGRQMKMFTDPVSRDPHGFVDQVKANLPFFSEQVPPLRNVWGEQVKPHEVYGRIYDAISPYKVTRETGSPIDNELVRLDKGKMRIQKSGTFLGAKVNWRHHPEVYDRYVQLAGGMGDPDESGKPTGFRPNDPGQPWDGLTLKEYLDGVLSGNHSQSAAYALHSDHGKKQFIDQTVSRYRQYAQQQVLAEAQVRWPEFYESVVGKQGERAQQREVPPEAPKLERIPTPGSKKAPTVEGAPPKPPPKQRSQKKGSTTGLTAQ